MKAYLIESKRVKTGVTIIFNKHFGLFIPKWKLLLQNKVKRSIGVEVNSDTARRIWESSLPGKKEIEFNLLLNDSFKKQISNKYFKLQTKYRNSEIILSFVNFKRMNLSPENNWLITKVS